MRPANYAVILSIGLCGCQNGHRDDIVARGAADGVYVLTALEPKPDVVEGPVVPDKGICSNCRGTGLSGDRITKCVVCNGTGRNDTGDLPPFRPASQVNPGTSVARSPSKDAGMDAVRSPKCTTGRCPVSSSALPEPQPRGRLFRGGRLFRRRQ